MMDVAKIKAYIAARIVKLEDAVTAATDPNAKFEYASRLEEIHRIAAWIDVKEAEDTIEDRGGAEL